MRKKKVVRYHTMRVLHPGLIDSALTIPAYRLIVTNATRPVTLDREERDILFGVPGHAGSCVDARCILRLKDKFNHPVLYAEVATSKVWIVTKLNKLGHPTHCIRYDCPRKEGDERKAFDIGIKGAMRPHKIHLTVPGKFGAHSRGIAGTTPSRKTGAHKLPPVVLRNAFGRALRAKMH